MKNSKIFIILILIVFQFISTLKCDGDDYFIVVDKAQDEVDELDNTVINATKIINEPKNDKDNLNDEKVINNDKSVESPNENLDYTIVDGADDIDAKNNDASEELHNEEIKAVVTTTTPASTTTTTTTPPPPTTTTSTTTSIHDNHNLDAEKSDKETKEEQVTKSNDLDISIDKTNVEPNNRVGVIDKYSNENLNKNENSKISTLTIVLICVGSVVGISVIVLVAVLVKKKFSNKKNTNNIPEYHGVSQNETA